MNSNGWQQEANCKDTDPEIFFDAGKKKEYKPLCDACPVQKDCLLYALIYGYSGIWGGLTEKERKRKFNKESLKFMREDWEESGLYDRYLSSKN
jgi:hypothetical protein